jgi:hypothetical protein
MRVALVNLQLGEMTGVSRAQVGQARAARAAGLPVDVWIVHSGVAGEASDVHRARYATPPFGARAAAFFKSRLLASVEELDRYDVVFLRYPGALDLDVSALFRRRRPKIVTVHHTKEVEEILSVGRSSRFLLRAALERVNGPRLLRRTAGIVGVTDEIRRYEVERSGVDRPSCTIANGIDLTAVPRTGFMPFDGRELRLLFVISAPAPWHGDDRLIASLRKYRGPVRLVLDLVGEAPRELVGTSQTEGQLTVNHRGTLHGAALDEVFRQSTLAVGSLAIFRKGLREACALKTREYIARGIPFFLGYDDVDLPVGLPFYRHVGNSEALFEAEPLIEFAASVSTDPAISDEMRAFAEQRLDWKIKLREFNDFAERLLDSPRFP